MLPSRPNRPDPEQMEEAEQTAEDIRESAEPQEIAVPEDVPEPQTRVGEIVQQVRQTEIRGGELPNTFLNPPEGWKPTDEYIAGRLSDLAARSMSDAGFVPSQGQTSDSTLGRSVLEEKEWDYKNPPLDENGNPLGPDGERLPVRAEGWTPQGNPYFGEGFKGAWNRIASAWQTGTRATIVPKSREFKERQKALREADGVWEKVKTRIGQSSAYDSVKIAWATAMAGFELSEQIIERPYAAYSMTVEDAARRSDWKPLTTKHLDWLPHELENTLERASPVRIAYNSIRDLQASLSGDKLGFDEWLDLWRDNWEASRMGWSIGANQQSYKQEFLARVEDGENPDLVAMDMQKPLPEYTGRAVFDTAWFVDKLAKGAKMTGKLTQISDDLLKGVDEVAEVIAKHGDESVSVLRGSQNVDEIVEATGKANARIANARQAQATKFGLGDLWGQGKRSQAATEAGIFGEWVAALKKNPDEATEIYKNMAKLASDDALERKEAITYLIDAIENPEPFFSEGGLKFGQILRKALVDDDGVLDLTRFADEFLELQKTGDTRKVWDFIATKMDDAINETFPTVKEAVEAGEEVPFFARLIARAEDKLLGKVKRAVNWFAGRAYIGTRPGVAIRGGLYDLMQSVVDTDMSILTKTPNKWAEISVKWLGTEHPGLTSGFSKAQIEGLEKIITEETGYKNLPSYLEAIRGGEDVPTLDKLSLPFARLLERLEISSSQRLIGKAVDDAMKHILRQDGAFPAIDELVEAGLPQAAADDLVERIISNYGDVEKVRGLLMEEIADGSIDLFASGRWLDKGSREILNEFGLMDDFLQAIKSGKPMREILDEVWKLRDDLYAKADNVRKQHVQAVIEALHNPENVAQVNRGLYEAIEGGAPLQEILDKSNDVFQINRLTKDAWVQAGDDIAKRLINHFRAQGNMDAVEGVLELRAQGLFDEIGQVFGEVTGRNRELMDDIPKWAKRIRNASDEELPAVLDEVQELFNIDDLPKDRSAANMLWEIMKGDRQALNFRTARKTAATEFDSVINRLRGALGDVIDDDTIDNIVNASGQVERARLLERLAVQFDDAIMVNGELKPFAEYTRSLLASGNVKDAIRTLASYTRLTPGAKAGSDLFDNKILRILNDMGIEADNLSRVDPTEAFDALQEWRNAKGLSRQADNLEDLLGYRPNTLIPEGAQEIFRMVDSYFKAGGADSDEIAKIIRFIEDNGTGDQVDQLLDITRTSQLPQGERAGRNLTDELFELARDIQNKILDHIVEGTGEISNKPATAEMRQLLKGAGIDFSEDVTQRQAWKMLHDAVKEGKATDAVKGLIPPYDEGVPTEARHIWEMRHQIDNTFARIEEGIKSNFGRTRPVGVSEDLVGKLDDWFGTAQSRIDDARLMSSKYAQGVRDFALHDYSKRYGFDAALSYLYNFHFWPSRTAYKWMTSRIWRNPGLISAYFDYRNAMQEINEDAPDWWKYAIRVDGVLGMKFDNPLFFRLENTFQPIYLMMGADFVDDKKRVNWWSTALDVIGRYSPGYYNPLIQYGVAAALKSKQEDEAAARWAGRLLPTTGLVKSISSLLGAREGKGVEIDPSVRIFSGELGPYERNRVAKTLAQFVKDGRYSEEEIIDAARNHSGPAWEEAMAAQQQKYALGNIISTFAGINTRERSLTDLETDKFWSDYTTLWGMSDNMTSEELRYNMEKLKQKYPFMDALLLGRKGKEGRDTAYAYAILSRVRPGKTDDISEHLGLPYDMIQKFYNTKGDFTQWEKSDRDRFMSAIVDLGASLELPSAPIREEWLEASTRYGKMREEAKELFGEDIWTKIDTAYNQKKVGMGSNQAFDEFLEDNPIVEQAMTWRTRYILQDPVLSAYYGGLDKLRSYYMGQMYKEIENELGGDVWDKWSIYWSLKNTGQEDKAKRYYKQNPELNKYGELKEKGLEEVQKRILSYADDLPEGEPMRLREDFEPTTVGEQQIQQFMEQPEIQKFTTSEWVEMIGPETTRLAILAYEGQSLPGDIRNILEDVASQFDMTYEGLLESIGTSQ